MSINVKAYFGTSLLNRQDLGRLQQICLVLAPSWSKGLRICEAIGIGVCAILRPRSIVAPESAFFRLGSNCVACE